jgi:hypothetical protein
MQYVHQQQGQCSQYNEQTTVWTTREVFELRQGKCIYLLYNPKIGSGPTQAPAQCVPGSFAGIKPLITHLHLVANLRMIGNILRLPHTPSDTYRIDLHLLHP